MALRTQGTTVHVSNEDADATAYGSATFAKVGEVTNIPEADGEANDIDTTHLESVAEESLVGLKRFGSKTISMNGITGDAGHTRLIALEGDDQRCWLKITWSNGTVHYWKANVKKYRWSGGVDSKIEATATFKLSGDRTIV